MLPPVLGLSVDDGPSVPYGVSTAEDWEPLEEAEMTVVATACGTAVGAGDGVVGREGVSLLTIMLVLLVLGVSRASALSGPEVEERIKVAVVVISARLQLAAVDVTSEPCEDASADSLVAVCCCCLAADVVVDVVVEEVAEVASML